MPSHDTTRTIAARVPNAVAALVRRTAKANDETVSDFVEACVLANLNEDALAAARQQG